MRIEYSPGSAWHTVKVLNVCLWWDGTIRPGRGHKANCKWKFDGQFYYHL